eukprot:CAMPEP_0178430132 /NCGR_PEP_ID=MMETSP0689_2-20121128/31159_1 /TAXON_ID=160604 /ORGANISM="Amphidinium massartii, Strain CS-259" /LENGTH=398 /DNA_ID=CAMNT_0020051973 /DNA_START=24 /DNA_END=1220 /DNA_ORIENTATION=+
MGSLLMVAVQCMPQGVPEECEDPAQMPQASYQHAFLQRSRDGLSKAASASEDHLSMVQLLVTDLQQMIDKKGSAGLTEIEVLHLKALKTWTLETVLPSVLQGAKDAQAEIQDLHKALRACGERAAAGVSSTTVAHAKVQLLRQHHQACRLRHSSLLKESRKTCDLFHVTKAGVRLPLGGLPGSAAEEEVVIRYLNDMSSYFCGRAEAFRNEWKECDSQMGNATELQRECGRLQADLEVAWCSWKTELESSCAEFEHCWQTGTELFHERARELAQLAQERKAHLEELGLAQCFLDVWQWDGELHKANQTKLQQCHAGKGTTGELSMAFHVPELPVPSRSVCKSVPVTRYPCDEEFLHSEYNFEGVAEAEVAQMRDACRACAATPQAALRVSSSNTSHSW